MHTQKQIRSAITKARESAGLTKSEAAAAAKWPRATWAMYELGHRPIATIATLRKMARAVGKKVEITFS